VEQVMLKSCKVACQRWWWFGGWKRTYSLSCLRNGARRLHSD